MYDIQCTIIIKDKYISTEKSHKRFKEVSFIIYIYHR